MKAAFLLTLHFCFILSLSAQEGAVATARQVYDEVNGGLNALRTSKHIEDENGYPVDFTIWQGEGIVRKLTCESGGDHGVQTTEFYYAKKGELVFVYRLTTTERIDGTPVSEGGESRTDFDQGALVKWLDAEKKEVDPKGEPFSGEEAELLGLQEQGLAAFGLGEDVAKVIKVMKEGATTGVFQGVEQGDYFYLQVASGGKEASYLVLQAEGLLSEVMENPERYSGKTMKFFWQEAVLHIPEAGGEQEMTVCVKVEAL